MHRAYTSILPTSNKLLQQRWDTTYYEEHRRKVKEAAPMVDTRAPPTYMHLHLKLKKLQLEEERLATIERDNRILLEKMSFIMRTRGRIDNRNNYEYKSLNREKRQRELLRVTEENQAILRRITMRNAEYSADQLQLDWEENQRFMDSISRFPKDWWKKDEKRVESRTSQRSNKQKQSKDDDVSRKSGSQNDEKENENKKEEEEKEEDTKDTKNTKDSKNKKTNKNKKDVKKGTKDSKKGDNSKDEETKKGDNSKGDDTTKNKDDDDNTKETKGGEQKETVKG